MYKHLKGEADVAALHVGATWHTRDIKCANNASDTSIEQGEKLHINRNMSHARMEREHAGNVREKL